VPVRDLWPFELFSFSLQYISVDLGTLIDYLRYLDVTIEDARGKKRIIRLKVGKVYTQKDNYKSHKLLF
jgi:hypothetical protein